MTRVGRSLGLALALAAAVLYLVASDGVVRLDHLLYDRLLVLHERPADPQVAIVAIDEKSLRRLGRWPWSREVHARLVDRLGAARAAAVGFDVLFSEPDRAAESGDRALASAIARNGGVVLALGPEERDTGGLLDEVLPLPEFAAAAAALGHIDFELDDDGIGRRVYLHAGLGTAHWPAFALALLETALPDHPALTDLEPPSAGIGRGWIRSNPVLIPYAGPPGHVTTHSFIDVLEGRVPETLLADRIVLIGATAVGLGDVLSTPLSHQHTLMPGIEVNANLLLGLLDQRLLTAAPLPARALYNLLCIVPLLLWLMLLPARFALPGLLLTIAATAASSAVLLKVALVWYPPAIALLLQAALFALWSWLDLHAFNLLAGRLGRQVQYLLHHDRVTGLGNRTGLYRELGQALGTERVAASGVTVLAVNMGREASVVDLVGSSGLDALQRAVAGRIRRMLPSHDRLFYLDRTEYAVLIDDIVAPQNAEEIAARLVQSLQRPFEVGGESFTLQPSIGASHHPSDGTTPAQLLDAALAAMHRAREDRRVNFFSFTTEIRDTATKRSRLDEGLKQALANNELECIYQPQVALPGRRLIGVETLVRWHSPRLGDVSPAEFIPLAEREGLIVPIGAWILVQACHQGAAWRTGPFPELRIAVNLSATQFEAPDLVETVQRALAESGLPASALELELTETALLEDFDAAITTLQRLKEVGVELAIDDFGTGYSSLTYLQRFPMDRIKIDQTFVGELATSPETAEITSSIIAMAHRLGLAVIAEGIETHAQLAFLESHGCDEAQGYLFGRPMSADALSAAFPEGAQSGG